MCLCESILVVRGTLLCPHCLEWNRDRARAGLDVMLDEDQLWVFRQYLQAKEAYTPAIIPD